MKRKIYKIILIILLIIEIPIMYLTFKTFSNKEINKVSYNENIKSKSTLAYYIDGELQEGMTSWPTDKEYEKAECYYGNHVEVPASEVLSFDNTSHTATITSNKTIYCSLYFGKTPSKPSGSGNAASVIDKNSGGGTLETVVQLEERNKSISGDIKDDLRRFIGTKDEVTDNFICFGTNSQKDCKDNMDIYMYRIMGIDTEGRLKLIKATKLVQGSTSTFQWFSDYTSDIHWNESGLYSGLNGSYYAANTKYSYMQDTAWTNLIDTSTYYIGDSPYVGELTTSTYPTLFQNERSKAYGGSWPLDVYIGLMYLSDYLYANNGYQSTNNWLFIQNGLNGTANTPSGSIAPTSDCEWTMTRYADGDGRSYAWGVEDWGTGEFHYFDGELAVRPVFYLSSEITITDGNGYINTPYIISPQS